MIDHPAFELVEEPACLALYNIGVEKDVIGVDKSVLKFLSSGSPSSNVRIPKFGRGLRPSGVSVQTKRTQPDHVDVNDRPGVSGDGRYTSPVNPFPSEEKLVRAIFSRRRKK